MNGDEAVIEVVGEWVQKAESDLVAAAHLSRMEKQLPVDVVCFHAQQCVEKYLKALLTWRGIEFPKTHAIDTLVGLLPGDIVVDLALDEQRLLTIYATTTRYPGTYDPVLAKEARKAVTLARRVRRNVRTLLPAKAKTKNK